MTAITGYQAAMLINELIKADGLNRSPIKPQMMYQYMNKGKIATVTGTKMTKDGEFQRLVELAEVKKFYENVIMTGVDATRPKMSNLLDEIKNI